MPNVEIIRSGDGWEVWEQGELHYNKSGDMSDCTEYSRPWGSKFFSAIIASGVTRIGNYAFCNCGELVYVEIPQSVRTIGNYAFYNCNSLERVTIPEGVESIGEYAFNHCYYMTEIVLPASLTSIGEGAFWVVGSDAVERKYQLVDVYYAGTQAQWNAITKGTSNHSLNNATIHYNSSGFSGTIPKLPIAQLNNPLGFVVKHLNTVIRELNPVLEDIDNKQDKETGKGLSTNDFTNAYKATLDNAVTGIKGNEESAYRTGNVNITPANIGAVPVSSVGTANGVAELDTNGKVLSSQLPSYVDDVLEYASVSAFPATGESGKIYVSTDTNLSYRWTGNGYVEISPSLALGETSSTAYRGDRGKTAYDHAQTTGNAHNMTKADIGLGNVDNTSDANKPVSTAQQAALDLKQNKESGKGLSTNDYTTAEKTKLANIAAEANKTIIDTTLSNAGQAADAKATGDEVSTLKAQNALFREYFANMDVYRTASGNPATFSDGYPANVRKLAVTITPTQSGSGDPYPPGGGKNKLNINAADSTINGVTYTVNRDSGGNVRSIVATGTATADSVFYISPILSFSGDTFILSGCPNGGAWSKYGLVINSYPNYGNEATFTGQEGRVYIRVGNGQTVNNLTFYPMIRRASDTDPTFAPYSNVRPISGVSSVTITRTGENGANSQSVTVSLVDGNNDPLTVYGGTLDVTTGELVVTHQSFIVSGGLSRYANYDTATHYGYITNALDSTKANSTTQCIADSAFMGTSSTAALCVRITGGAGRGEFLLRKDLLADNTAANANAYLTANPIQVVAPLATPLTYQLTPQQLATLAGYNSVTTDAGTVSVTYKANPAISLGGG